MWLSGARATAPEPGAEEATTERARNGELICLHKIVALFFWAWARRSSVEESVKMEPTDW